MNKGFKIIDSDMHVREPLDLWERYTEAPFRDRAPRIIGLQRGLRPMTVVNGRSASIADLAPDVRVAARVRGMDARTNIRAADFAIKRGWDSTSQLEAMAMEGLDVAVLFPSSPGLSIMTVPDLEPPFSAAIARAYNNWLYDFCQADPRRLKGAALLPVHDVTLAVREARRAVKELGFVSVFLRAVPPPDQAWFMTYWEPLWAELADLGVPAGFHEGFGGYHPHLDRFGTSNRLMRHICDHPTSQMVTMVDVIIGGVLERFPTLKVAFLECNCGWLPSWLSRMDHHAEQLAQWDAPMLRLKPSDYFKRQCVISAEPEERELPWACRLVGHDNFVFSTDYPHPDSDFPRAVEEFLEQPISDEAKHKILWENCARFYGVENEVASSAPAPAAG